MANKRSATYPPDVVAKHARFFAGKPWCHVNPYTMEGISPACIKYRGIQLSKLPEPFMLVQWLPDELKRRIIFDYCPGITAVNIYLTNRNFAYELGVTRETISIDSKKRYGSGRLSIAHRLFDDPDCSQDERLFGYYSLRYLYGREKMGAQVNNAFIETLARRDKPEMIRHFMRHVDLRFVARAALQYRAIKILKGIRFECQEVESNRIHLAPEFDWTAWSDWTLRDGSIFTLKFSPEMITMVYAAHCKDQTRFEEAGVYIKVKQGGSILRSTALVLAARFANQTVTELFSHVAGRRGVNYAEQL